MLSDNLLNLRRRRGLSQEQLADQLGVSRQAISKWEGGQSTPELEKLMAISKYFNVSLDELTGELSDKTPVVEEKIVEEVVEKTAEKPVGSSLIVGVILSVLGAVLVIIAGLIILTSPSTADQINASSVVTINGTGIFFILSLIPLILGVALILRKK